MIQSFADAASEDIFHGKHTKAARTLPRQLWNGFRKRLDQVNNATTLADLKLPSGNELHALTEDQAGRHAIKVNDQYRVTFRFADGHAHEVRCEDYH